MADEIWPILLMVALLFLSGTLGLVTGAIGEAIYILCRIRRINSVERCGGANMTKYRLLNPLPQMTTRHTNTIPYRNGGCWGQHSFSQTQPGHGSPRGWISPAHIPLSK